MSHIVDAYETHRQQLKKEYKAKGLSDDEADERATNDVRREIRNGPPIKLG